MIATVAQGTMIVAAAVLALLVIDVVAAMPRHGAWVPWLLWTGVGVAAVGSAVVWRAVPLPTSLLVLALSLMLWRQRKRLTWATARGDLW